VSILGGLEPKAVFYHFEQLTKIPRESGNERRVSDFLVRFAKENGLDFVQEDCLNVIISKPGTEGYEDAPEVILQGHMDMVCVKNEDILFDFNTDPIPIFVDGDMIRTKGTTLGADNGIAVAMILAILESKDMPHPPLTALITVSEETGMDGVLQLDPSHISGDILINLDSEDEGILLASCAGGVHNIVRLPISRRNVSQGVAYDISIQGLTGGHSGLEIDKNRANAIKLLGRVLQAIENELEFDIVGVKGGEKMNAIPTAASATIVSDEHRDKLDMIIEKYQHVFREEYGTPDPYIAIHLHERQLRSEIQVISPEAKKNLLSLLILLPTGVQTMSANIKGLVESSNNIGVLETKETEIVFSNAVRSSVRSLKEEINQRIQNLCLLTGAEMELVADYPEWEFKTNSPIRDLMLDVYQDMYGKEAKVDAIHAGLECGFLQQVIGDIDMISLGPDIFDVHSPNEHLSISSTNRVYKFLCEVLKRVK